MKQMMTGPMQFTPHRPWEVTRKVLASMRSQAIRATKIAEQTDLVFDPLGEFTEIEMMILGRLAGGGAFVAHDVCRGWWPVIEEMAGWDTLRGLEGRGYLFRSDRYHWSLTGCGWLRISHPQL